MSTSAREPQRALAIRQPVELDQKQLAEMKSRVMRQLVGVDQLGKYTNEAAFALSEMALLHGLSPFNGEVYIIPKKSGQNVVGYGICIGYKGLQRSARRQAHFSWGEKRRLDASDLQARGLHVQYDPKVGQSKAHNPEQVIVIEKELHRMDTFEQVLSLNERARDSKMPAIPYNPFVGRGVWYPGQPVPVGRDAEWLAEKRAEKDALTHAYDLGLVAEMYFNEDNAYIYEPPEGSVVIDAAIEVGDEEHVRQGYTVEEILAGDEESEQEEEAFEPNGPSPQELGKLRHGFTERLGEIYGAKGKGKFSPATVANQVIRKALGAKRSIGDVTPLEMRNLLQYALRSQALESGQKPEELGLAKGAKKDEAKDQLIKICQELCQNNKEWEPYEPVSE